MPHNLNKLIHNTITSMNAREQLTGATYGSNLAATFGVDSYGYPNASSAGSLQDYRYAFDPVTGNLDSRQNFKRSLSESFSYTDNQDNLDRLTSVTGPRNLTLTYAANGNILTKSDISSSSAFTYGNSTGPYALTGATSSTGVIPAINQTATYTSSEKVTTLNEDACSATFVYNSQNQRAKMEVSQNETNILTRWYAGSSYMKETEGGVTKEFTYIGGDAYTAPVAAVTRAGTTTFYYLLRDYLGNITHLVNSSNQVVAEYNFDAWGRRRSADDWSYTLDQNDLELFAGRGFTAHESLPWFNLVNMNGRLYDPLMGRFLSPDPFVQMPDYTQNLNRYSYCLNNPLKYTDPDGEFLLELLAVIVGNYVIGWLDNVINKHMSPKEAFRNTNFIIGVNFSPADMSKQKNYGFSNPQVDAHNAAKHEEEVSKELDKFVASQSGRGRYKDIWSHTIREGQNFAGISREYYGLFDWMDIQSLNPGIDVYNGGQPLPAGTVLQVPGPISTLGVSGIDTPGIPEGKWGGLFQLAGQLILDTPHSSLYYDIKPGELRQNRAYYNAQLGNYEWSRYQDGIMEISNFANFTYYRGTWRGVYRISTGYYNERGYRLWSY